MSNKLTAKQELFCRGLYGYEDFYSIRVDGAIITKKTGRERFGSVNKNGYVQIAISNNKKTKTYYVHRLVALSFLDNKQGKPCVNHIDGNKLNNHVSNLEWVTYKENMNHAIEFGIDGVSGIKNHAAKLTHEDVKNIKIDYSESRANTYRVLSEKYGVSVSQIYNVVKGISFKEVCHE